MTPPTTTRRKVRDGVVVSDKMDKTVVVLVERLVRHQRYHKFRKRRARYKAHDETNRCRVGDRVRIVDGQQILASHPRSYDKGDRIEDPAHVHLSFLAAQITYPCIEPFAIPSSRNSLEARAEGIAVLPFASGVARGQTGARPGCLDRIIGGLEHRIELD